MIDTRLITFLALLEERNYTATAKKMYITQPAVSHHIKSLEKDLEVALFTNTKTFDLTEAGKIVCEYAKTVIAIQDQLFNTLKRHVNGLTLNVGLSHVISGAVSGGAYSRLLMGENKDFSLLNYPNDVILEKLLIGELDFGIIDVAYDEDLYNSVLLSTEKIVLVCSPNGKYSIKDRVTRSQLTSATVIMPNKDSGLYQSAIYKLETKNIKFKSNIVLHTNDVEIMTRIIESDDAIGFAYEANVEKYVKNGRLKKVELLNFNIYQNIYVLYNKLAIHDEKVIKLLEELKGFEG